MVNNGSLFLNQILQRGHVTWPSISLCQWYNDLRTLGGSHKPRSDPLTTQERLSFNCPSTHSRDAATDDPDDDDASLERAATNMLPPKHEAFHATLLQTHNNATLNQAVAALESIMCERIKKDNVSDGQS